MANVSMNLWAYEPKSWINIIDTFYSYRYLCCSYLWYSFFLHILILFHDMNWDFIECKEKIRCFHLTQRTRSKLNFLYREKFVAIDQCKMDNCKLWRTTCREYENRIRNFGSFNLSVIYLMTFVGKSFLKSKMI